MYCIKCGNKLGNHMKFCDQCGAPVPVDPDKLESKKEDLKEFKAPIIDKDPMDLVPEEFEEKPSESEAVKEEIVEEIKEDLRVSKNSEKEELFKDEKVEKVEKIDLIEPPKIIDEPLDKTVEVPKILETDDDRETLKLEVHEEILNPRDDLRKDISQEQKIREEKTFKDQPTYRQSENYPKEASLSPVKIVAGLAMVLAGFASISAVLSFFEFFFSFIGGIF